METAALPGMAAVSSASLEMIELFTWVESTVPPPKGPTSYISRFAKVAGRTATVLGDIFAVPAAPASTSTSSAVASGGSLIPVSIASSGRRQQFGSQCRFCRLWRGCVSPASGVWSDVAWRKMAAAVAVEPNRIAVVVRGEQHPLSHVAATRILKRNWQQMRKLCRSNQCFSFATPIPPWH